MTTRLHITYVLPVYWPVIGGCEIHTRELVSRMSRRHRVDVFTTISRPEDKERGGWFMVAPVVAAPRHEEFYADGATQVTRVGLPASWKTALVLLLRASASRKLPRWANRLAGMLCVAGYVRKLRTLLGRPDVIHAINGEIPWLAYATACVARERGIPLAFTGVPHIYRADKVIAGAYGDVPTLDLLADTPPQLRGVFGEFFVRTCKAASALFTMTDGERRFCLQSGLNTNVQVTGVGPVLAVTPSPGVRQAYGIPEASPLVLFLGRVNPDKGVAPMIAAARLVWQEIPDAHFLFVGPFEWGSQALFAAAPDRRLIAAGALDLERKTGALQTCDLLCVPSVHESLGGVYLEAWSFGKPVIGANILPFRELTGEGQGGVAVEPTPTGIAHAILYLLRNPDAGRRMGAWGRKRVAARYNWDAIAGIVENCYLDLAGGAKRLRAANRKYSA